MSRYWLFLLLIAWLPADAVEADREIRHLLEFVAASGCVFVRNGSDHDSVEAAQHLELKYDRGRRYAGTAEEFIDRLATKSSWTGRAYTVRCGEDSEPSARWLHRELARYRQLPPLS